VRDEQYISPKFRPTGDSEDALPNLAKTLKYSRNSIPFF
jgi:hypothetical protein